MFFANHLAEDIGRVGESGPTWLLDNLVPDASDARELTAGVARSGAACSGAPVRFFETLHTHDFTAASPMRRIHARLKDNTASDLWLENQFLAVAGSLWELHREAGKRAELIPAKKVSTRLELYRRLTRGKDYMDSFFEARVRLEQVAANACLSPYHFHRLFREVSRDTEPVPAAKAPGSCKAHAGPGRAQRHGNLSGRRL